MPNVSPKGVIPAGKTKACPPAKDFVAFYLQQGRKRSVQSLQQPKIWVGKSECYPKEEISRGGGTC